MRSVEDYAKAIIENSNLNFNKLTPGYALDEKNKIGIRYHKDKGNKHTGFIHKYCYIRFLNIDEKECNPFLYIHRDELKNDTIITFPIRDNDKSDAVRIYWNGYNIEVFLLTYREQKLSFNREFTLFINGTNLVMCDKNNNQREIIVNELDVNNIVNEICEIVANMDHITEKWNEEINKMLDFVKPAIAMIISDINEVIKRRLIAQEETKSIVSHKK